MKKFWNALIAAAIGGALTGAAEAFGTDGEPKHIGKAAAVGAAVTVAAFLKNSNSDDENPGDDDQPSHTHKEL